MEHQHISIVNKFFDAYAKKDLNALHTVLSDEVTWIFPGHHHFSGIKKGFDEVVRFFDTMSGIMGSSGVTADRLFIGANDRYVVEYQHLRTDRPDKNNLDHHWCVAWKIKNGKIVEGRHFAGDQHEADRFFHKIMQSQPAPGK